MSFLRIIGPASIEVWISSPVRSRKPVLMKTIRSFAAWMQAARLAEVRRSSSIMPDLDRVARQAEQVLDRVEQLVGERDFLRPVHLRLDDIDRAGAAVAERARWRRGRAARSALVTTASRMPSGASPPSGSRIAGVVIRWPTLRTNSRLRPGQVSSPPSARVSRGRVQRAGHRLAALVEALLEIALHQAEPVAVGRDLVLGIDRGDRILEVDDRRQRRFEHDVGDARPDRPCRSNGCGRS